MIIAPPPHPDDMPPTQSERDALLAKMEAERDALPVMPHDDIEKALGSLRDTIGIMAKMAEDGAKASAALDKARYRSLRTSTHELVAGIQRLNQDVLARMSERHANPGAWLQASDVPSEVSANG